ncbi:MAG: hypothetical protein ABSF70_19360 [Terracidiphilus sp.]|jgi:hypothetical protein
MNSRLKSVAGSLILGAVIAFALGVMCFYEAKQYAALAPNESTATAHLNMRFQSNRDKGYTRHKCEYSFSVEGASYHGYENCPLQSADDPVKGELLDYAGVLLNSSATVYYDPANPSTNSLTEFGAMSERDYLYAELGIGAGTILSFLVIIGALIVPSTKTEGGRSGRKGGIVVDAEGTVIYPDEINSGRQESADNSNQAGSVEEQSDGSANY